MDKQNLKPYRILLADDHNIFRRGLKKLIEEMEDLDVVGEAGDGLCQSRARADTLSWPATSPKIRACH